MASPSIQQVQKESETTEEVLSPIFLKTPDYQVFLSLVGQSQDRSISLDQVKILLTALNCNITTGHGRHQKATAENNQMWTIPGEWDGPIPHYYRQQLMDFLLADMDIDPANVHQK